VKPNARPRRPPDAFARAAEIFDPQAWEPEDRPPLLKHQKPPPGRWKLWVLMAGRGAGKTEAASRYYARWMREHPLNRGRIIAPTLGDVVEACVEGPSGLLSVDDEVRFHASAPGGSKVVWPNGSEALLLGTDTPKSADRFRAAGNRHLDWWEEMAACRYLTARVEEQSCWHQAQLGLRLGDRPHSIASTTPRNRKDFKKILTLPGTVITRATLYDNPYTNPEWRREMEELYRGTRLGRQEIGGELLEEIEGALWTPSLLDVCRVDTAPEDLVRVAVGVDPSGSEDGDEQGIVVGGVDLLGRGFVLGDRSCRLSPEGWAKRAIQAYLDYDGDAILWESNFGGDMVQSTIRAAAKKMKIQRPALHKVVASRGKLLRAQPVAALYGDPEQLDEADPLIFHPRDVDLTRLEDQQTTWTPESGESPDRLDAHVMVFTHLLVNNVAGPVRVRSPQTRVPSVTAVSR
jgi:phage terminase large subunit-like protein